jgi:transposase
MGGMSKTFRPWTPEQTLLMPPAVQDWVEPGHVAHFVMNLVSEQLDLRAIVNEYGEERGRPPFHPVMMVGLVLYSYTQGIYSSRRMAKACRERVDFMMLAAQQQPDFRTINGFRKRHLENLKALFGQVVRLCCKAGLANLGHVALDGTKMKANASKYRSMRYGKMNIKEAELQAEVDGWFEQADQIDEEEDRLYGEDKTGEELPDWVKDRQKRLEKIRQAKAELEAEARAEAKKTDVNRHKAKATGEPKAKAERNFTDPESRKMKGREGFVQGYNCQAAVDTEHQIIVAQYVTNKGNDFQELKPLLDAIKGETKRQAREISADAGYNSEDNLRELKRRRVRGYVANRYTAPLAKLPRKMGVHARQMWQRIKRGGKRSRYWLRCQTAEPVFGQIKQVRNFRHFLLRGVKKVSGEWSLLCTAHNLLKLAGATTR